MTQHRIPSLDGARAISIVLVIIAHLDLGRYVPGLWRLDMGNLGVRVFFVISGFIITKLLLDEVQRTGSISLASFYRRRLFRIVPAYYLFLGTVLLLSAFGLGGAKWTGVWPAAFFLADYVNVPLVVGHTWSLAVEEQFYLLWPSVLVMLGVRRSVIGCVFILLLAPIFRVLAHVGVWPTSSRYAFECVADALAVGCLLAIFRDRLWRASRYRELLGSPIALVPVLAALFLVAVEQNHGLIYDTVGLAMLNFGIAMALDRYMRFPELLIARLLNEPPVVWIGLVSYSLYLWQQLFAWMALPCIARILLMLGCASVSYQLVEKPMLKLRRRLESRRLMVPTKQPTAA